MNYFAFINSKLSQFCCFFILLYLTLILCRYLAEPKATENEPEKLKGEDELLEGDEGDFDSEDEETADDEENSPGKFS